MKNDFDKTLAEGRRRFQKMTKKGSKNDVLAPPFWGDTGQNGQKPPFLAPGGGSHTPKFGGGPPPRTRIGAFLDFLGCRCFLEMCKQVLQRFVQICFDNFSEIILWKICERFVEDLFRDFTETLMTNWSKTRSTIRRIFCGRLCARLDRMTDRHFVEDFVQDLIDDSMTSRQQLCARFDRWPIDNSSTTLWEICGRHIWQKYLRDTRE